MNHHESIIKQCLLIEEELERKEQFRINFVKPLMGYEFMSIKSLFEIEEKTESVIKDTLVEIANRSMKKKQIFIII